MRRLVSTLALAVAVSSAEDGGLTHRSPRLSAVFPQGAEPGTTLEVEILGEHLDRAAGIEFLGPGVRGQVLESRHTRLALRLEVQPSAPFGPHHFRAISPRGASNLLLFRVGDQPHTQEAEPNGVLGAAQVVRIPVTLNGRLDRADDIDIYRFEAAAGHTWIFDLRAARNGSGLDASMILLDGNGTKLRHSEDHFIWDPFFSHSFEASGEYFLALQPTRGRARPAFGYQLDIRKAPHLDALVPLALTAGSQPPATLVGAGLHSKSASIEFSRTGVAGHVVSMHGDHAEVRIAVGENAPVGMHALTMLTRHGRSNTIPFWVHDLPAHTGGTRLAVPSAVVGTARYAKPERFEFNASEGETLVFEILSQRLGSPTDMTLRIVEATGGQGEPVHYREIASNDDAKLPGMRFNKDPKLVHAFRESGTYELQVRNLVRTGSRKAPYYLAVREPRPRLDLLLGSDAIHAFHGDDAQIEITTHRIEGYSQGANLLVLGLPQGVHASPLRVPPASDGRGGEDGRQEKLSLTLRAEADEMPHATIEIVASGSSAPAWRSSRIASGGGEGATEARIHRVAVAPAERQRFEIEAQSRTVNLVRGGRAEVPVTVRREDGYAQPIRFGFENLPEGVTFEPAIAEAGASGIRIVLRAADDARRGTSPTVAILGADPAGRTEQAPVIAVVVE